MNKVNYSAANGDSMSLAEFFRRVDDIVRDASLEISDDQQRKAFVERASRLLADAWQACGLVRHDG